MSISFATPWTIARQAPWSMGFPRQEYWNGLPFPSPGDLPIPGSPVLKTLRIHNNSGHSVQAVGTEQGEDSGKRVGIGAKKQSAQAQYRGSS